MRWLPFLLLTACGGGGITGPLPEPVFGGITLNWSAPSQYEDESFLGLSELDEFRIYVNRELFAVVEPHVTTAFLPLPPGEWEITMTSIARGIESFPSNPLLIEVPLPATEPEGPPADPEGPPADTPQPRNQPPPDTAPPRSPPPRNEPAPGSPPET